MGKSTSNYSLASVIVLCRNEKKFIGKCLESIIANDYSKDKLEVLVVDGMSEDGTREIVENYREKHSYIRLIDNPKKLTPFAFNEGIKNSHGELVIFMSAHAIYEPDYISKSIHYLEEYGADNVGGVRITLPRNNSRTARAIAHAISHPFAAGNAFYRTGAKEMKWVDTVFGGCYRREIFEKIGPFNELLTNCQDKDLNIRLREADGKILLAPDIKCYYYARTNLKDFLKYSFKMGFAPFYFAKISPKLLSWRNYFPLFFILFILIIPSLSFFYPLFWLVFGSVVFLYLFLNFIFSLKIAIDKKDMRYLFLMFLIFPTVHILYGIGSLWGYLKRVKLKIDKS